MQGFVPCASCVVTELCAADPDRAHAGRKAFRSLRGTIGRRGPGRRVSTARRSQPEADCVAYPVRAGANRSRSTLFCTLPIELRGSASAKKTCLGTL